MNDHVTLRSARSLAFVLLLAAVLVASTLAACGGSSTSSSTTSAPPSTAAAAPSPSPTLAAAPWRPGSDSLARTAAVAAKWANALHAEKFAASHIWAKNATLDLWAGDVHETSGAAVKKLMVDAAPEASWTSGHLLVRPGVAASEGLFAQTGFPRATTLDLLAVSGGKVVHEDIYIGASSVSKAKPAPQWASPPTSADTVARSKETAAAFAKAVAAGDSTTIRSLLHKNVMFYDTAQKHPQLGASAAVDWFASTKPVTVQDAQNVPLIVGRGWAVARWTATGADAATSGIIVPGATVMEIRGGKVVRLTVYSDSTTLPLHD